LQWNPPINVGARIMGCEKKMVVVVDTLLVYNIGEEMVEEWKRLQASKKKAVAEY